MLSAKLENFVESEISCRCCGELTADNEALISLQAFRYYLNRKYKKNIRLSPTCGMRCKKHNANLGGAKRSLHLSGQAFDLVSPDISYKELYSSAVESRLFSTIIRYDVSKFVHVDTRARARYAVKNWAWDK